MSNITVIAAEGVRAKVTIQKFETVEQKIPEVRDSVGQLRVPAETRTHQMFVDADVVTFASEARSFDIGPGQRLLVEEQQ